MVQYYTLQEAAAKLRVSGDALKEMAKNGEVRAFQDRGSLRFRAQEIDELARMRGLSSEPDLQLGDAPEVSDPSKTQRPPVGAQPQKSDPSVFDFTLGTEDSDEVSLGQDLAPSSSKDIARKSSPPKSQPPKTGLPKTPSPKPAAGMRSPPPSASDSDVRLVSDGTGLDFQVELDRGSRVEKEPPSSHRSGVRGKDKKKDQVDSGVRIVPLDKASDSDVKMVPDPTGSGSQHGSKVKRGNAPSDSDIRIESGSGSRKKEDSLVTEEIDLDAEARKAEEATQGSKVTKPKRTQVGPGSQSPFELAGPTGSGPVPQSKAGKSGIRPPLPRKEPDTSNEFELTPADARPPAAKSSVIKTPTPQGNKPAGRSSSSNKPPKAPPPQDMPVLMGDEDVNLGELTGAGGGSGINLKDPADSGISLEQGGSDEIEFELSLDSGKTPAPVEPATPPKKKESTSSNEFELSLDEGASDSDSDSESEFELSLDVPEGSSVKVESPESDSDSEFELSLDEAGGLAAAEESESDSGEEENKDIFETDFEVPALEEGSGSEAVALEESGSESSSDFDLDLDQEGTTEGETGSQVVALDDGGDADEGAETVAKPRRKKGAAVAEDDSEEVGALDEDLEGDLQEEPEVEPQTVYLPTPAPEWGVVPALALIPTVIVMFLCAIMTFELVQGLWSFHRGTAVTGPVTHAIAGIFTDLPKSKD
jgi:excisionase family DNA binding protein